MDNHNFTDDKAHFVHTATIRSEEDDLATTLANNELKSNKKKSKLTKVNITAIAPVIVGGESIRAVESFVYKGSAISRKRSTD